MSRLTRNPDTRIAQSLELVDRPSKGRLEAALDHHRKMKRVECAQSKDTARDLAINLRDLAIAHLSSEIVCRRIEDVEIGLIALTYQLEIMGDDVVERHPTAARRLRLFVEDDEYTLALLHAKLAYHLRESARFRDRIMN